MKKTIAAVGLIALFLISASVQAQQTWDAKKNPTVDSIIAPFEAKMIPARTPATTLDIYPAIGSYESATNTDAPSVAITLDEQNKGVVWVEGLPQGKIKAMLRKSPATYKIPAQKTEDGKDIPEGTLIFDKDANTLSIVIGKPYNAEDPSSAFATATTEDQSMTATEDVTKTNVTKTKTRTAGKTVKTKTKKPEPKPWTYTGTKVEKATSMSNQQPQPQQQ